MFDTNVVVSALVFAGGRLAWLRAEWQSGRLVPLVSRATAEELIRVLSYPKFRLSQSEREELLADYLPFADVVIVRPGPELLRSRDDHDQMFIELAATAKAEVLVSGDPHLLDLAGSLTFEVLSPGELATRLGKG